MTGTDRENRILRKLTEAQNRNQALADRILAYMENRGCHLRIYVSSGGLRFEALDKHTAIELENALQLKALTV